MAAKETKTKGASKINQKVISKKEDEKVVKKSSKSKNQIEKKGKKNS